MLYERRRKGLSFFKFSVTRIRGIRLRHVGIYRIKHWVNKVINVYKFNIYLVRFNLELTLFFSTFFSEFVRVIKRKFIRLILLSLIVIRRIFHRSRLREILQIYKIVKAKLIFFFK